MTATTDTGTTQAAPTPAPAPAARTPRQTLAAICTALGPTWRLVPLSDSELERISEPSYGDKRGPEQRIAEYTGGDLRDDATGGTVHATLGGWKKQGKWSFHCGRVNLTDGGYDRDGEVYPSILCAATKSVPQLAKEIERRALTEYRAAIVLAVGRAQEGAEWINSQRDAHTALAGLGSPHVVGVDLGDPREEPFRYGMLGAWFYEKAGDNPYHASYYARRREPSVKMVGYDLTVEAKRRDVYRVTLDKLSLATVKAILEILPAPAPDPDWTDNESEE